MAISRPVGRSASPGFLDLDAAHFQADAELQIGRHQRAAVLFDNGLDVAQDRLDVPGGNRGAGELACRQESFAVTNDFHAIVLFLFLYLLNPVLVVMSGQRRLLAPSMRDTSGVCDIVCDCRHPGEKPLVRCCPGVAV